MNYFSKLMLNRRIPGLVTLAVLMSGLPLAAVAQGLIPPNQQPGAIMQHNILEVQRRQREPWLYRPIEASDYLPYAPEEPVIEYRNLDLQGNIILPGVQQMTSPIQITPEP